MIRAYEVNFIKLELAYRSEALENCSTVDEMSEVGT